MPPRHNDAFDDALAAHLVAYTHINARLTEADILQLRDMLYSTPPIIFPSRVFDSAYISFETATDNPPEEAVTESSEELDNFLKEFALKEVC